MGRVTSPQLGQKETSEFNLTALSSHEVGMDSPTTPCSVGLVSCLPSASSNQANLGHWNCMCRRREG